MRCGRTLHKEQDLIHASVDEFIDEAGARLRTADNGLTGFDQLFHRVGSVHRHLLFETLDDVLVSRRRLALEPRCEETRHLLIEETVVRLLQRNGFVIGRCAQGNA